MRAEVVDEPVGPVLGDDQPGAEELLGSVLDEPGLGEDDLRGPQLDLSSTLPGIQIPSPRVTPLRINLGVRRVSPLRISLNQSQRVSPLRIQRSRLQSTVLDSFEVFPPRRISPLRISRIQAPSFFDEAELDVSIVHGDDTVEILPGTTEFCTLSYKSHFRNT